MIRALLTALLVAVVTGAQAQQQPQRFDPIVIDAARMNEIGTALDEIQMPPRAYKQIMSIFQQLELRAQADADKAKAAAQAEKPKN